MIRDYLVTALRERFPQQPFTFSDKSAVASLKSPCREVDELVISDDGDEVTVFTNITTSHFACDDETLPTDAKEKQIVRDVVGFVSDLLEDRVIMWRAFGGWVSGIRCLKPGDPLPRRSRFRKQFLWSRPL